MWSLKDDEYQTNDDQPLDELGVQPDVPEEEQGEEEVVRGDTQQEEDNGAIALNSQEFETEMVFIFITDVHIYIFSFSSLILLISDQRSTEINYRIPSLI